MRLFSQNSKIEALKRAPLLEGLSQKELAALAKTSEDLEAEPGKVLCREGEIGREFFVILEGEVEVTKDGKPLEIRGGGDFFGEIALIEDVRRVATVTAKTPIRFFVLTSQTFRRLLDSNPSIERKVLRALAKRVLALSDDAV